MTFHYSLPCPSQKDACNSTLQYVSFLRVGSIVVCWLGARSNCADQTQQITLETGVVMVLLSNWLVLYVMLSSLVVGFVHGQRHKCLICLSSILVRGASCTLSIFLTKRVDIRKAASLQPASNADDTDDFCQVGLMRVQRSFLANQIVCNTRFRGSIDI